MSSKKRICFFDVDGTLLNSQSMLGKSSIRAIKDLKKHGTLPVIATGRSKLELENISPILEIDTIVSMNGHHIEIEGKTIHSEFIPMNLCRVLHEVAEDLNHPLLFCTTNSFNTTFINDDVKELCMLLKLDLPAVDPVCYLKKDINMMIIVSTDPESEKFYSERFPNLKFIRTNSFSFDVTLKNINKATGLGHILNAYPNAETFAFGDGLNDIEMFKLCHHGIAMKNASIELKKNATYITDDNDNDGVVKALKHFNLI